MKRLRFCPEGHTLYWVYAYWPDGNYEFETTKRVAEARKMFSEYRKRSPETVAIFFGNEDGAFTQFDPVRSWYVFS